MGFEVYVINNIEWRGLVYRDLLGLKEMYTLILLLWAETVFTFGDIIDCGRTKERFEAEE